MIAPIEKIKSLLNDDIVSLFGDDVINNAYIESYKSVIELISDEFILEDLSNAGLERAQFFTQHSTNVDSDAIYSKTGFTDGRKILSVLRKNTVGTGYDNKYYEALKIPTILGQNKATNSNSVYYENDRWNPKYYNDEYGKIIILPKNLTDSGTRLAQSTVYFISFPDFNQAPNDNFKYTFDLNGKNFSTIGKTDEGTLFYGIPGGAKELVYIQMALNLVQNYMADFIYDEEDQELVNLAKEHTAALLVKKQDELKIVIPKYSNERKA
jgi:hypothetical protein